MSVVLGIDAAWTATEPSGVALVASYLGPWRCVALAPSYQSFLELGSGTPVDWSRRRFEGSIAKVPDLLTAARTLAGAPVDLVAIDMPIALAPITGRRAADRAISHEFGARGCAAHSPNATRPGSISSALSKDFTLAGFPIATTATHVATPRRLIEVYPHPAILELLGLDYRARYKVAKAYRYWPYASAADRISSLLVALSAIQDGLERAFGPAALSLPATKEVSSLRHLKRYEDVLDALVCAWAGVRYLQSTAVALGDETAAIWCPRHSSSHG